MGWGLWRFSKSQNHFPEKFKEEIHWLAYSTLSISTSVGSIWGKITHWGAAASSQPACYQRTEASLWSPCTEHQTFPSKELDVDPVLASTAMWDGTANHLYHQMLCREACIPEAPRKHSEAVIQLDQEKEASTHKLTSAASPSLCSSWGDRISFIPGPSELVLSGYQEMLSVLINDAIKS